MINAAGVHTGITSVPIGTNRLGASGLLRNPIAHSSPMIKFDVIQKYSVRYGADHLTILLGTENIEIHGLAEDYFLFGQLAIFGKCTNIPQHFIKYLGMVTTSVQHDLMRKWRYL